MRSHQVRPVQTLMIVLAVSWLWATPVAGQGGQRAQSTQAGCPTIDLPAFDRCAVEKAKTFTPSRTAAAISCIRGLPASAFKTEAVAQMA